MFKVGDILIFTVHEYTTPTYHGHSAEVIDVDEFGIRIRYKVIGSNDYYETGEEDLTRFELATKLHKALR